MTGWRLAHLPALLAASGGLLVAGAIMGLLVAGGAGAAGAAVGVGMVAASYLSSTLAIAWADSIDPRLVLPVGLGAYLVKFTLIGIVMAAVVATGWEGLPALGAGVVAGVVTWTATQVWWVVRHRPRLEYRPPGGAGESREPG
jgi:hypothetical protein